MTSFTKKSSNQQVPRRKISKQQVSWTKSVLQREKSMYKFHEQKNQHATSLTKKYQHAVNSTNKKSAGNKLHEQNSA